MNPIFMVGAERSGTTLLRLMLDGHPQISWLNEFEYSVDQIPDTGWPDLDSYQDYLSRHRIFSATGFTIDPGLSYPELIKSFLGQKQSRDNKSIIGATCHRHYDKLLRLFPNARFIYLLRDPRDVARSNIYMGWAGNVWTGVERWREAEALWAEMKARLPAQSYIEVRSEELVTSSRETLTAICDFLKVDYDPGLLSYPERTTYSRPDPTLTEQWKRKLTERQIGLVEAKVGEAMVARGYPLHLAAVKPPSGLEQLWLLIQDKLYRTRFRIDRFGLPMIAGLFLSRILGLSSAERRLEVKYMERERAFVK
ncbi:MAG: sulfotransferase [Thermodesulfobacteriota bacterium]